MDCACLFHKICGCYYYKKGVYVQVIRSTARRYFWGRQHQGRNEVRWHPGQEASLAPACSKLASFGRKCTVSMKVGYLWHCWDSLASPAVIRRSHSDSAPRELFSLLPLVTPLCYTVPHENVYIRKIKPTKNARNHGNLTKRTSELYTKEL